MPILSLAPLAVALQAALHPLPPLSACPAPSRVSRQEILDAMRQHGPYSLLSTTTSALFGAQALLAIVHRRLREHPDTTQLLIDHADWFAAHLAAAGVGYAEMSETARAAYEHRQDALVSFTPSVVREMVTGPAPRLALDITLFWPDTGQAPDEFSYRDTLAEPRIEIHDARVVRFALLEYALSAVTESGRFRGRPTPPGRATAT